MTTTEVRCPHCQARFAVPNEMLGTVSRCGRCQQTFTPAAPPPKSSVGPVAPRPVLTATVVAPSAPNKVVLKPVTKAPVVAAAPVSRRAPIAPPVDDEDDYEEKAPRPRRRKPEKNQGRGLHPGLIVGMSAGAVVVLGAIGLLIIRAVMTDPSGTPAVAANPQTEAFSPGPSPAVTNSPAPAPPVTNSAAPQPTNPGPKSEPTGIVKRVKESTVYIRCEMQGGLGMGSGFFAGNEGYVATNAHVIGCSPRGPAELPQKIQVVVHSGEASEQRFDARIVGIDVPNDLALLWIDPKLARTPLPTPLPFGKSADLIETQEVYIYGFPHGESLGLNISVNKTTVSSLRKRQGQIEIVQVAGGMHPGNSGGPVVDKTGQVIGVSVAVIKGEQINFAIPAEITQEFVRDRIANPRKFVWGEFGAPGSQPGPQRGQPGPRGRRGPPGE